MRRRPHPNHALLLIEVSDSSIELDREKALEYAAAAVPEYWIVNRPDHCVEVFRNPLPDAATALGFRYGSQSVHAEGEFIASILRPDAPVAVSALVAVE